MEPNIRLVQQDTYLVISKLDQMINVCRNIQSILITMLIIWGITFVFSVIVSWGAMSILR